MIKDLNPYVTLTPSSPGTYNFILDFPDNMIKSEEWKPLTTLNGYEASSLGRIRNIESGHILRQKISLSNKYPYVNTRHKPWTVHRLVCEAFHGVQDSSSMIVNHIDRVTTNNRADNLEWCTYSENGNHWISQYGDDPKYDTVAITDSISVKYVTSADSKLYRDTGKWVYGNNKPDVPPQYDSNNIWIHNKELNLRTVIPKSKLEFYEKQGWVKGNNNHKVKGYKTINKDGKERTVDPKELDYFLADGWVLGSIRTTNKGRKPINKDGKCIMVSEDELQSYLDDGWVRGYGRKFKKLKVIHNIHTNKELRVKPEDLDKYISTGEWVEGARTNRMHIHKGDVSKFVDPVDWSKYESEGWLKGRAPKVKQKISATKLKPRNLLV